LKTGEKPGVWCRPERSEGHGSKIFRTNQILRADETSPQDDTPSVVLNKVKDLV